MSSTESDCQFPKCTEYSDLIYLGKGLCEKHWKKIAEMEPEKAYAKLGIKSKTLRVIPTLPEISAE